jgi:hypothetical protein
MEPQIESSGTNAKTPTTNRQFLARADAVKTFFHPDYTVGVGFVFAFLSYINAPTPAISLNQ